MPKLRNPVARAAIMRKGGAHVRTRSSERAKLNRRMKQDVATALEERAGKKPIHRSRR